MVGRVQYGGNMKYITNALGISIFSFIFIITFLIILSPSSAYAEQKVLASDADAYDLFGDTVSIDGDVAIIGALGSDYNGSDSKSAYIFRWDGSAWIEEQILVASDADVDNDFGRAVSINGDVAVIGATWNNNGTLLGSAYIFRWDGSSWIEEQKILASNGTSWNNFGGTVSIDGDVAIIGADMAVANGLVSGGSAYVFRWDGSSWVEEAILIASDAFSYDCFGKFVVLENNVAIIASANTNNSTMSQSSYVFRWDGSVWNEEQKLSASDGDPGAVFGSSIAVNGNRIIIGANQDNENGYQSGSAYIFEWDGNTWFETVKLLASDGSSDDFFGISVSLSGDEILIGASRNDDNGNNSGSAYFYDMSSICSTPNPAVGIYVDSINGLPAGPGGDDCPFLTITDGISEAISLGFSKIIVRGGLYFETVILPISGLELEGEMVGLAPGIDPWLPPIIMATSPYQDFLVEGNNDSSLKYFILAGAGIELDGMNNMIVEENFVLSNTKYSQGLYITNGGHGNTFSNNIFIHNVDGISSGITLDVNSFNNTFINNTVHTVQASAESASEIIGVYLDGTTSSNTFINNIMESDNMYGGTPYGFYSNGTPTATIDYNLLPTNNTTLTLGTGNITFPIGFADFVDPWPTGFQYNLNPGSDAIDNGNPDPMYNDIDGSQNDMGATGGPNSIDFQL